MKTVQINKSHPLNSLVDQWRALIGRACEIKQKRFGKYADEARKFFNGGLDSMWDEQAARGNGGFLDKQGGTLPNFRMVVNKPFEAVALFGPALYHQNPSIMVTARLAMDISPEAIGISSQDPYGMQEFQMLQMQEQMQQAVKHSCAQVKQTYLNWLQGETDKKTQSRRAITEAIVDGLGVLWTEMYTPPNSQIKMPRSVYVSQQDIVVDPDADYWEDVQWIARKCVHPVNLVEKKFGYEEGELKGTLESIGRQATMCTRSKGEQSRKRQEAVSYDLIEYWEIYSKNGMGDRLKSADKNQKYDLSVFGDYCYLAVAHNIPFPLNLPTSSLEQETGEQLIQRAQWPVPYWTDACAGGGWPMSRLSFYENPKDVWPIGLFKPVIAELKFVNWCMSFLADKVASSSTTYVGILKDAAVSIQKQLAGEHSPFTIIELSNVLGKKLSECVEFLQAPQFQADIWTMVAAVMAEIDKRTGITELMHGLTTRQIRSAAEAEIKDQNISVRPDDMASKVEDWLTEVALREMQAARWYCEPQDVVGALGQMGAMVWQNSVMTQDIDAAVRDYDYRIEAGSSRKPNKANRIRQLNEFGQVVMPTFQALALGGMVGPFNAFMSDMAKAMDMDASGYMVELPQQQGPSPEEQQAQLEMEATQMEMQAKEQEMQLKGVQGQMDIARKEMEMQLEAQARQQEIESTEILNLLAVEKAQTDIALTKQKAAAQAAAAKAKPKTKPKGKR